MHHSKSKNSTSLAPGLERFALEQKMGLGVHGTLLGVKI